MSESLYDKYEVIRNLYDVEEQIFSLESIDNVLEVVEAVAKLSLEKEMERYPYTFEHIVCRIVLRAFISRRIDAEVYLTFLKKYNENGIAKPKFDIVKIFVRYLKHVQLSEGNYLLQKMIENRCILQISNHMPNTMPLSHRIRHKKRTSKKYHLQTNLVQGPKNWSKSWNKTILNFTRN